MTRRMSKRQAKRIAQAQAQEERQAQAQELTDRHQATKTRRGEWEPRTNLGYTGLNLNPHDMHGPLNITRPTKHDRYLLDAWQEDRIRWDRDAGRTRVIPRPIVGKAPHLLEPAHLKRAHDDGRMNEVGKNGKWNDAQVKAEKQFAYQLRTQEG